MDGSRAWEGRVEYYHNGVWGSICDYRWDHSDAQVVCRQLGYEDTFRFSAGSEFGFGSGVIHLTSVNCIGTEESLEDCYYEWSGSPCDVTEEAGVVCGTEDGSKFVRNMGSYLGNLLFKQFFVQTPVGVNDKSDTAK